MIFQSASIIESKVLRNACIVGMMNTSLVPFLDKEFIPAQDFNNYVLIQAATFMICVALLLFRKIKGFHQSQTIFFLHTFLIYSSLCQFFIPCSYVTFFMTLFVIAIFSTIKKRIMMVTAIPHAILMITCIWMSSVSYSDVEVMNMKFKMDSSQAVIFVTALILWAHSSRLKEVAKSELLSNRLISMGSQSLMFIHDLKGQIFAPLNHSNYLASNSTENKEVIEELNSNLKEMRDFIVQANQSFSLSNEIFDLNLSEILNEVKILYRSKFSDIDFEVTQDENIKANPNALKSMLINLILNSEEEFSKKSIVNKKIKISYKNKIFLFKDNAGGFSESSLKKIAKDVYFSNKKNGSGVGLYTIKSFAQSMSAKVSFYNDGASAVTQIKFPKKVATNE